MPRYRVKGSASNIVSAGVLFVEGDEIELPVCVALELRHQLEPLEKAAQFPDDNSPIAAGLAPHERKGLLSERRSTLLQQIALIDEELAQFDESEKPRSNK
jgi:hypothetical protein